MKQSNGTRMTRIKRQDEDRSDGEEFSSVLILFDPVFHPRHPRAIA
jgi:hypothetical protein